MAKVSDVIEVMEKWASPQLAESWDNVGLCTGEPAQDIASIVVALDITEDTIALAKNNRASMIVSHHPPIFKPLKTLAGNDRSLKLIRTALQENIALYSAHTNLDQAQDGVSHALAEKLGLITLSPLCPGNSKLLKFVTFAPPESTDIIREAAGNAGAGIIGEYRLCSFTSMGTGTYIPTEKASPYVGKSEELSHVHEDRIEMIVTAESLSNVIAETMKVHPYEEMPYDIIPLYQKNPATGYGAVGNLREPMNPENFCEHVAKILSVETLHVSNSKTSCIKRVAVMGGSGGDYISWALSAGADAYVTGEIGYHDFLDYGLSIVLIDASHRATELPVLQRIKEKLEESPSLKNIEIIIDRGKSCQTTCIFKTETINESFTGDTT